MKKMADNKTIIVTLVLILVAVLVSLNFEKFTGQATKTETTQLYASSNAKVMDQNNPVVGKGEYVYFTEMPGIQGGSGTLYIREMSSGRKWGPIVRTQTFKNCNSNKCNVGQTGTLNFRTYYDWEGKYCGEVTDFATWKTITTCFTVK